LTIVYIGLGSNQGDRISYLQQGLRLLTDHEGIKLLSASSFYETEPVGDDDQHWFVNVAIAVETALPPEPLLAACLKVENQLGRKRDATRPNGPRTLDIDLLLYDNLVWQSPELTLPHPEVHKRAFVLVPLLEVNAKLIHPVYNKTMEQLHQALEAPEEVYLYGTRQLFE
jgi:2-amino-4-hydroxy-6-hydroxymethyldihydropteridine diphosphokinase